MNDIQHARNLIHDAEASLKIAKEALEKAQKQISLEHLGVYELENGDVVFARTTQHADFWLAGLRDNDPGGRNYSSNGISEFEESPVKKHIGKIAIVPIDYFFHDLYGKDPLTFNKA